MEAYQWTTITILYQVQTDNIYAIRITKYIYDIVNMIMVNLFQDNDSMMTLKEIFGKTSTIGPMEVNEALKSLHSCQFKSRNIKGNWDKTR